MAPGKIVAAFAPPLCPRGHRRDKEIVIKFPHKASKYPGACWTHSREYSVHLMMFSGFAADLSAQPSNYFRPAVPGQQICWNGSDKLHHALKNPFLTFLLPPSALNLGARARHAFTSSAAAWASDAKRHCFRPLGRLFWWLGPHSGCSSRIAALLRSSPLAFSLVRYARRILPIYLGQTARAET